MKRHVLQKILGATILSLMVAVLSGADAQTPMSPGEAPDTPSPASPVELPPDIDPASALGQVIRLLQSGVDESVILAYINNSSVTFNLSSDEILYLNDLGAPADIVTAMIQHDQQLGVAINPQPAPPPPEETDQPPDLGEGYFYGALAAYGTWVTIPDYGLCWQPCADRYNPGWTPYCTQGQWVNTDYGWYWMSNYSWGWCAFHYGRWFHDDHRGWCWWPNTKWAPSWVCWRYSNDYCGWAPLPPHCDFGANGNLVLNGRVLPPDFDFGFTANLFVFTPVADFGLSHTDRYRIGLDRSSAIFNQSKVLSNIQNSDRGIMNPGISPERIAAATGRSMATYTIQPMQGIAAQGRRGEQVQNDGQTLAVKLPHFNPAAPASLNQGIRPTRAEEQRMTGRPAPMIIRGNGNGVYPAYSRQNNSGNTQHPAYQNGQPAPRAATPASPNPHNAGVAAPARGGWSAYSQTPAPANNDQRYVPSRSQEQPQIPQEQERPAMPPNEQAQPGNYYAPREQVPQLQQPTLSQSPEPTTPVYPSQGAPAYPGPYTAPNNPNIAPAAPNPYVQGGRTH